MFIRLKQRSFQLKLLVSSSFTLCLCGEQWTMKGCDFDSTHCNIYPNGCTTCQTDKCNFNWILTNPSGIPPQVTVSCCWCEKCRYKHRWKHTSIHQSETTFSVLWQGRKEMFLRNENKHFRFVFVLTFWSRRRKTRYHIIRITSTFNQEGNYIYSTLRCLRCGRGSTCPWWTWFINVYWW